MSEPGSDAQFEQLADVGQIRRGVRHEIVAQRIEEWRVSHSPLAEDEPGKKHPDPGPPPSDEPHDEYDPTPPKEA